MRLHTLHWRRQLLLGLPLQLLAIALLALAVGYVYGRARPACINITAGPPTTAEVIYE